MDGVWIQLFDTVAAVTGYIFKDGDYQMFSNQAFDETFMTSEEMTYKLRNYGVLPIFIWNV